MGGDEIIRDLEKLLDPIEKNLSSTAAPSLNLEELEQLVHDIEKNELDHCNKELAECNDIISSGTFTAGTDLKKGQKILKRKEEKLEKKEERLKKIEEKLKT